MDRRSELAAWIDQARDRLSGRLDQARGLDPEATTLMLAGVIVGALGALAAVVFDGVMGGVGELVLGTAFPARFAPAWWRALLGPPCVGLVVGLLVQQLTRRGRPQGMADVLARVRLDEASLSLREGTISALTAALAVGGGFSGGREGPIIQFASAIAAWSCRVLGVRPARVRTLVAAGAAGGIAASFNTPLGAAFFALEILLGNFAVTSFAPVVAATVTGTVIGQALLGDRIALHLPPFTFRSTVELPLYLLLGAVGAVVAFAFKRAVVEGSARIASVLGPPWVRPVALGLVIGVTSASGFHQVMGNGYGFMEDLLRGDHDLPLFLIVLLGAKIAATTLTVASRTGAGLFAPSLFIGAVTGSIFGLGVHSAWPAYTEAVGTYGIVGMGAVAAAVLNAPITMALMLFEMTGNYHVILPLMLALASGGLVSAALGARSLEEMELEVEGLSLAGRRDRGVMHELSVGDVYRTSGFEVLREDAPLADIVRRFLERRVESVYVVTAAGSYKGTVHLQDAKAALADPSVSDRVTVRRDATVHPSESLATVLPRFFDAEGDELPVINDAGALIGVLSERDVVATYHLEALRTDARLAHIVTRDSEGAHDDYLELPAGQSMSGVLVGAHNAGKSLRDLALPARYGCTVVAMSLWDHAAGDWYRAAVDVDRVLQAKDKLVVIGPTAAVRALETEAPPAT